MYLLPIVLAIERRCGYSPTRASGCTPLRFFCPFRVFACFFVNSKVWESGRFFLLYIVFDV